MPHASPPKNIALFIDGTWNSKAAKDQTNVRKLFDAVLISDTSTRLQVTYYLPGVGTDIKGSTKSGLSGSYGPDSSIQKYAGSQAHAIVNKYLGGVFGHGTEARIREAYAFLCTEYNQQRGDRVFIFGFSRGAFAARSLAGFIGEVGILLKDQLDLLDRAYQLYESDNELERKSLKNYLQELTGAYVKHPGDDPNSINVHFLGVWDTVGALGIDKRVSKFSARRTEYHQVDIPPNVMTVRHAIALHEQRSAFEVLPFPHIPSRDMHEMWFQGAHADVGGGYPTRESGYSNEAMLWMASEANLVGLEFNQERLDGMNYGNYIIHSEIKGTFKYVKPVVRTYLNEIMEKCARGDNLAMMSTRLFRWPYSSEYQNLSFTPAIIDKFAEADLLAIKFYILNSTLFRAGFSKGNLSSLASSLINKLHMISQSELARVSKMVDDFFEFKPGVNVNDRDPDMLWGIALYYRPRYFNYSFVSKFLGASSTLSKLFTEGKIDREQLIDFRDRTERLLHDFAQFLSAKIIPGYCIEEMVEIERDLRSL